MTQLLIKRIGLLSIALPLILISCKTGEATLQNTDYKVISKNNINRVRFSKVGEDENRVEIVIRSRGQMTSSGPQDVYLQGSSGIQETSSFRGYDEVGFPFTGGVSFSYQKQEHDVSTASQGETESFATTARASLNFVIKTPGKWIVNVYY